MYSETDNDINMNEVYDYVHEKLSLAVASLAIGTDSLQQRLADAYIAHLGALTAEDFPEHARDPFQQILRSLTHIRDVENTEGHIQATVDFMSDEKAVDLARQIVKLFYTVTEAYYGASPS